jgi:hypothetical protein
VDHLGSLLIVATARFFLFLLTTKEAAMARPLDRSTEVLKSSLKVFAKETITSFGLAVILKAVMVPPALRDSAGGLAQCSC